MMGAMTKRDPDEASQLRALGERVRVARGSMTQSALAEATGINQSTLSKYERGESEPGTFSLAAIARVCRVPLTWLATGEGDGPPVRAVETENQATGTEG